MPASTRLDNPAGGPHLRPVLLGLLAMVVGAQPVHTVGGERFLGPIGTSTASESVDLPPRPSKSWGFDVQGGYCLAQVGEGSRREGIMAAFAGLRVERRVTPWLEVWAGPGLLMGEAFLADEPGTPQPVEGSSVFGSLTADLGVELRLPVSANAGVFLAGGPHLRWAFTQDNEGTGAGFQGAGGLELGGPASLRWAVFVEGRHTELGAIDPTVLGLGLSVDFPLLL